MNCFLRLNCVKNISSVLSNNYIQVCHYAARKGTREKMRKKKVKVEVKKVGFIPHNLRDKGSKGPVVTKRTSDDTRNWPVDDVWIQMYYKWRVYNFQEAVEAHRETHHPQIYNVPDAPIHAFIELDMRAAKKNKFMNSFTRVARSPHQFDHGEDRTTLVFCKTPEARIEAESAGATLIGDIDIIKKIEKGDIVLPDFQHILAHPNILPELTSLRGLLKRKFPNVKSGTLGTNIGEMVTTFRKGIQYTALQDSSVPDYGFVDAHIGNLNMEVNHLEENFKCLLEDINMMRPKRPGPFITRALLTSAPSVERLKVGLEPYLAEDFVKDAYESDSDDESTEKAKAKAL
ncbi:large ribosomal subunit protein uL1m [Halyomorpha halys]|uniref:large ribosomal subunit protein uL1m n=1 Tax=Halyomorpha halys TaxID=286706 RepID=UPI0006D4FEDB|nr:39S ribosomal protein L1, mitochondrial [Halyomorpha halys]